MHADFPHVRISVIASRRWALAQRLAFAVTSYVIILHYILLWSAPVSRDF